MSDLDPETRQAIADAAERVLTPEALADMAAQAERMVRFGNALSRLRMSSDRKVTVTLEPHECESLIWGMQLLRGGSADDPAAQHDA